MMDLGAEIFYSKVITFESVVSLHFICRSIELCSKVNN